jgi:two-component system, OmpR family, sensor kinase
MIHSVRGRLTAWHAAALAVTLGAAGAGACVLFARELRLRFDQSLQLILDEVVGAIDRERAEGESYEEAAESAAAESALPRQAVAIFDVAGKLLGRRVPAEGYVPRFMADAGPRTRLLTEPGPDGHGVRIATRRHARHDGQIYMVTITQSLRDVEHDAGLVQHATVAALLLAAVLSTAFGWVLVGRSLAPIVDMCEKTRRIGERNVSERLPVANPRDELGTLALTMNELLERLAAALERQRQFMADASHELRTPVSIVGTAAAVTLERPARAEDEYREALMVVADQGRRLARLVDDMFLLARVDAGRYPIQLRDLRLDEIAADAVRAAGVLGRQRGITLELQAAPSAPFRGDLDLLRRMLTNLLDNAMSHSDGGGRVSVAVHRQNGRYLVTVSDLGPGIPAEEQSRVFDRFHRGSGHDGSSGAGLGLAIARWIAEAHGGTLRLGHSDGSGTTFVATLTAIR